MGEGTPRIGDNKAWGKAGLGTEPQEYYKCLV